MCGGDARDTVSIAFIVGVTKEYQAVRRDRRVSVEEVVITNPSWTTMGRKLQIGEVDYSPSKDGSVVPLKGDVRIREGDAGPSNERTKALLHPQWPIVGPPL